VQINTNKDYLHGQKMKFMFKSSILKRDKAKFKAALRKHLNTHFFYSIDEFFICKDDL